jgi:hypothetical protein
VVTEFTGKVVLPHLEVLVAVLGVTVVSLVKVFQGKEMLEDLDHSLHPYLLVVVVALELLD